MTVGRPKGQPKTGGRVKGTLNKSSISFTEGLESKGFDLYQAIIDLYTSTQNENIKLSLIELITKFKHSVPKPIDVPIENEEDSISEFENQTNSLDLIQIVKNENNK